MSLYKKSEASLKGIAKDLCGIEILSYENGVCKVEKTSRYSTECYEFYTKDFMKNILVWLIEQELGPEQPKKVKVKKWTI